MITEINNQGFTIDDYIVGAGARVKKTKYTNWADYPGCVTSIQK